MCNTVGLRSGSCLNGLGSYSISVSLHNNGLDYLLLVAIQYFREILIQIGLIALELLMQPSARIQQYWPIADPWTNVLKSVSLNTG